MFLNFEKDWVSFSCGLGVVGNFSDDEEWASGNLYHFNKDSVEEDRKEEGVYTTFGTGIFLAAFIKDSRDCEEAYKHLTSKFTLLYESPVRENIRTGNQFYFCIFDGLSEPKEK